MKQKKRLIAILTIFVLFLSFLSTTNAFDLLTLPTEFCGFVEANGKLAPVGTEIVAKINGEVRGKITIKEEGKYGGSGKFDEKLVVQGDYEEIGEDITFWVNGVKAEQTSKYKPGTFNSLNLTVKALEDTTPSVGGGGARVAAPVINVPIDPETGAVTSTTTLTVEKATLTIPEGTLVKDAEGIPLSTSITTLHTPTTAEMVGAITAYDYGPGGTTFEPPIDLVIAYDPAEIPEGFSESDLVIRMWDGTAWIDFETTMNTVAHMATAKVSHFSIFALFAAPPVAPPPTPTPVVTLTPPPAVTPTPTLTPPFPVIPMFVVIIAIVAVVIIVAAAYVVLRRKRK